MRLWKKKNQAKSQYVFTEPGLYNLSITPSLGLFHIQVLYEAVKDLPAEGNIVEARTDGVELRGVVSYISIIHVREEPHLLIQMWLLK